MRYTLPMKREFPEEHELLWLFESEPVLAEPEEFWQFNTLNFTVENDSLKLTCSMSPYVGDMTITLEQEDQTLVHLNLFDVISTKVIHKDRQEYLEVVCDSSRQLRSLKLQIRPTLAIHWGMVIPK